MEDLYHLDNQINLMLRQGKCHQINMEDHLCNIEDHPDHQINFKHSLAECSQMQMICLQQTIPTFVQDPVKAVWRN